MNKLLTTKIILVVNFICLVLLCRYALNLSIISSIFIPVCMEVMLFCTLSTKDIKYIDGKFYNVNSSLKKDLNNNSIQLTVLNTTLSASVLTSNSPIPLIILFIFFATLFPIVNLISLAKEIKKSFKG